MRHQGVESGVVIIESFSESYFVSECCCGSYDIRFGLSHCIFSHEFNKNSVLAQDIVYYDICYICK